MCLSLLAPRSLSVAFFAVDVGLGAEDAGNGLRERLLGLRRRGVRIMSRGVVLDVVLRHGSVLREMFSLSYLSFATRCSFRYDSEEVAQKACLRGLHRYHVRELCCGPPQYST